VGIEDESFFTLGYANWLGGGGAGWGGVGGRAAPAASTSV